MLRKAILNRTPEIGMLVRLKGTKSLYVRLNNKTKKSHTFYTDEFMIIVGFTNISVTPEIELFCEGKVVILPMSFDEDLFDVFQEFFEVIA